MPRRMILLIPVLFACSGADAPDLFAPGSSVDGDTTEPAPPGATSPIGSGAPPSPPPEAPPPSTPPPPPACTAEVEPNQRPSQATAFDACLTGAVQRDDVDYGTITAPMTATKIEMEHEEVGGNVAFRIYVNGAPATPEFTGDPPDIAVIPGGTYAFRMRASPSNSNAQRTYVLRVKFE